MANRFLGEATVDVDGRRWTLRCDFNAMCEFEDATGKDALTVFGEFETGKVGVKDMRAMMWAFLQHHHPDATLQDAGDLLSANVNAMMEVIKSASPTADEAEGLGNAGPKRKAIKAA
jgi:hypothetical protein